MSTLLSELGGREAIEIVVAAFYERVLADPLLKGYFRGVQMSRLFKNQADFFCAALGDPDAYRGRDMRSVHKGMNIGDEEFDAVAQHLSAALDDCGVDQSHIDTVVSLIAPLRGDIVTRPAQPKVTIEHLVAQAKCPMHAVKEHGARWMWSLFALAFIVAALAGVVVWKGGLPMP